MAHTIPEFPEPTQLGRPKGSKYDKWLDGQIWTLTEGEDFSGDPRKFVRAIRQHANTRRDLGMRATVTPTDTVIIQSRPKSR